MIRSKRLASTPRRAHVGALPTSKPPLELLLACSALAGAAAHLSSAMQASTPAWKQRARTLVDAARALSGDVEALRAIRSEPLKRLHVARIARGALDAAALAMRLHNLLPPGDSARAAFDAAACAAALTTALTTPLTTTPLDLPRPHGRRS